MTDKLKQLQAEFDKNQAVLDRTRPALAAAARELDALGKQIYTLMPEDVEAFAVNRRRLQDALELLGQIANFQQGRCDELQRVINQETLIEIRESADQRGRRLAEIGDQLPFLALTDPERADLQKEFDALQRS